MSSTTVTRHTDNDRDLILRIVEEGHRKGNWSGVNLRSALTGVTAEEATWRPAGAKNSIAAITLHCAYWKNAIRTSLAGLRRRSFVVPGENWFEIASKLSDKQWEEYLNLLESEHSELVKAIKSSNRPIAFSSKSGRSVTRMLFGIAMHDAYHTGQIRLLRAMLRNRNKS